MKQVTISEFKTKMKVKEIKASLPLELVADGEVIAVIQEKWSPRKAQTQCPNCKLVYMYTEPDGKPPFFTCKHPKGG